MSKSGQARVPTQEQQHYLFQMIEQHRHKEKNTAIMQISFKLGLRVQEIALLQVKEVARLNSSSKDFTLLEIMSLPAAYTKGSGAMNRSKSSYERKRISFDIESFNKVVKKIETLAKSNVEINPENFYPSLKKHRGKIRDLPIVDKELRAALLEYLKYRISVDSCLKPSSPLFIPKKAAPTLPVLFKSTWRLCCEIGQELKKLVPTVGVGL